MNDNLIRELSSVFKGSMFMQKNTPHMWLKAIPSLRLYEPLSTMYQYIPTHST